MQYLVDDFEYIMAFTDGCSLDNPGKSGAGVSFYGIKPGPGLKKLKVDSSGSELSDFSQAEDEKLTKQIKNFEPNPYDEIEGCNNPRLKLLFSC